LCSLQSKDNIDKLTKQAHPKLKAFGHNPVIIKSTASKR